jgi:sugar/nucleoside kinase (ribokinase family)
MTPGRLLVVGELNVDIIVSVTAPPTFDQVEHLVDKTSVVLGSSSAITACGAAALGVDTSFVGVVGADLLGRQVIDELAARGVDTAACRVDPDEPTGSTVILSMPDGDRAMLTALGTIGTVGVDDVPESLLAAAHHVHVGSYFLQRRLWPDLGSLFGRCRQAGLTTSLDPNFDPAETWESEIESVLPAVDVLFCNDAELLGIAHADAVPAAFARLAERMPAGAQVVLKGGADGAALFANSGAVFEEVARASTPPIPGDLVDTVGAGDSLAAGFIAARLRGLDPADALRVGVANGTASTRRAGGGAAGQLSWSQATDLLGLDAGTRRV